MLIYINGGDKVAKYTPAQKKSIYKYLNKKAEIKIWLDPEHKARIQEAAAKAGSSVNAFVLQAVDQLLDTQRPETTRGVRGCLLSEESQKI